MPSVSFDGQSFMWNGRRLWLVGANLEYSLVAPERWDTAIASLRQMGFNTIRASVPWCLHECRRGRFDFKGRLDVAAFLRACRGQGMHVILRIGPVVGEPFDGGGLPAWIAAETGRPIRQVHESFIGRVSALYQALAAEVKGMQATEAQRDGGFGDLKPSEGGSLLAVQIEHGWNCGNEAAGLSYHAELLRFARERGFTVPVLTCNGLWIGVPGCVEVWEGWSDLFPHLRQLQHVQPDAPRLVEIREEAAHAEGMAKRSAASHRDAPTWPIGMDMLGRMGQILAAGGQPILPGVERTDRSNAVPALLDEGGRPNPQLRSVRRMVSFANHFGHVYADADGSRQVSVQAPDALQPGGFSVITVEGSAGRVNFVFRGPDGPRGERHDATSIISPEGGRLEVELGDAPVGWYLFGVSLHGKATLDWCNLSPWALIDRSLLVLQGPAGARAALSLDGGELQFTLPQAKAGAKPVVIRHQGMVVVGCNQQQIDAAVIDGRALVVGAERVHADGGVVLAEGFQQAFRVDGTGVTRPVSQPARALVPKERAMSGWKTAVCTDLVQGRSDRFARIDGPASLGACGAYAGWGWYRLSWRQGSGGLMLPGVAGLMHGWIDGKPIGHMTELRVPLSVKAGPRTLTVLARQGGRSAAQASMGSQTGLAQAMHVVQPMAARTKVVTCAAQDPFKVAAFIPGLTPGQLQSAHAVSVSFTQKRAGTVLVDGGGMPVRALAVLNGQVTGLVDWKGQAGDTLVLMPVSKAEPRRGVRAGTNELLLVPLDPEGDHASALARRLRVYRSVQALDGQGSEWRFARWEPPHPGSPAWTDLKAGAKSPDPRWFMACMERPAKADGPVELLCHGLSRGHVLMNDTLVGGYDLPAGRDSVKLPAEGMRPSNTLVIFDAEGRSPAGVRVRG